jgi:hypothetical protein
MFLRWQQKPTRGGSGRAARELIVARSRDRPNYTNLLHYTLGSPSVYAALELKYMPKNPAVTAVTEQDVYENMIQRAG